MDLHLFISYGFVLSKIYDKRGDFDFDIVNFPIWIMKLPVVPLLGRHFTMHKVFINIIHNFWPFGVKLEMHGNISIHRP